jgi:hypothetical protein
VNLRALTLIRPMAAAIVHGTKRIENRPKDLPKAMRGVETIVAVHAGKGWDDKYAYAVREFDAMPDVRTTCDGPICRYEDYFDHQGIVGLMRLSGRVFTSHEQVRNALTVENYRTIGRWFFGPFGYEIKDAIAFKGAPIRCKGMLGFWTVPAEVEAEIVMRVPESWYWWP